MPKKLPRLSIKNIFFGSIFLLLFIAFTFAAKFGYLKQFDFDATVKLQNHIPQKIFLFFSYLGLLARFDSIAIVLIIFTFFNRTIKSFIMLAIFACAHVVEYIGKLMFDHPGPPFMFYKATETVYFPDLYVNGSSYPSGHALRAIFIAVWCTFALVSSKKFKRNRLMPLFVLWGIVGIIVVGKIVLGQHWTSDVIGGMLLGLSFGFYAQVLN